MKKEVKKIFLVSFFSIIIMMNYSCLKPLELKFLEKGYPDIEFSSSLKILKMDFLITAELNGKTADFYWAGGKMVPSWDYKNKADYKKVLYPYVDEIPDPAKFTQDEIEHIREVTSRENRKAGNGFNNSLYDFVYESDTQINVEKHIRSIVFLGKNVNVHERIIPALKTVEAKIYDLAEKDEETAAFIANLSRVDGYNWREISDSGKKSKHSMGIAVDILPKGWGTKNLYWAWRRDIDPENWMLLPLDRRWLVPDKIVKIFEEEGFIYGAKWIIWDNMHFEYFPELIEYNSKKGLKKLN